MKSDGLYITKIHNHITFYKIINNKAHIVSKRKGKLYWAETILPDIRFKKLRSITELELINTIKEISEDNE